MTQMLPHGGNHPAGGGRPADLGEFVRRSAASGRLVVQPRMGMADADTMAAGLRAVRALPFPTVGTITLDAYTRVGEHDHARAALAAGNGLNGFPIVVHGPRTTVRVAAEGAGRPVQVRHGSATPRAIFQTMVGAGLSASEGGPVSYCLPYGRTPLATSVSNWRQATAEFAELSRAGGLRAHLETFGGCLMGQLCPPSLLVAMSLLEALFFAQQGVPSVSLSYAQQTDVRQDVEALAALRMLAAEWLPEGVDWHIVLYTYMGVFPGTRQGAQLLMDRSAELAVRGGAQRLIVKTPVEAIRLPTVEENLASLRSASALASRARSESQVPWGHEVDPGEVLAEARAMIEATLSLSGDVGEALVRAFSAGILDVPFCLHEDNQGLTQAAIDGEGRLYWTRTGRLPLPAPSRTTPRNAVTADRLLQMLRYTADRHDLLGLDAAAEADWTGAPLELPDAKDEEPYRVAVVGAGPRGLSVLERLAARLAEKPPGRPVEVYAVDAHQVGTGRIWRTDQPDWSLMNTVSGEVTIFSGRPDGGPHRAGAGPSLYEWWRTVDPEAADPDECASRAVYGRYLSYALDRVEQGLPADVLRLRRISGQSVETMEKEPDGGYLLSLSDGRHLRADRVVLTTGHPLPELRSDQQELAAFADDHPHLRYVRGDSAIDMPLDGIEPGSRVGILGLGLSFYDVVSALTTGRGGRYVANGGSGAGGLRYLPSGREPQLIAGSRGGVPLLARGRNQKGPHHTYRPRLFTHERMRALRDRGRLDFRRDVLPWLLTEVGLVYYSTHLKRLYGPDIAEKFANEVQDVVLHDPGDPGAVLARVAAHRGMGDLPPVDIEAWARPFRGRRFAGAEEFQRELTAFLLKDLELAREGNSEGPVKAALDAIRDVRGVIRTAVDFSGLTPASHSRDFLQEFVPLVSQLTTGPPMVRLYEVLALMESGVLRIAGPGVRFAADPAAASGAGRFTIESPQVAGSLTSLDAVVDARIPEPDLRRRPGGLNSRLYASGLLTAYVNRDHDGEEFATGGVHVTGSPFHPVRADGKPEEGVYVLGIPAEFTRWFTQVGSARPGVWGEFLNDADAIAEDALSGARRQGGEYSGLVVGKRWRGVLAAEDEEDQR
ncbi:FAD/NAD(P)-binding protein [Streptomyces sp. ISL-66]|uniref:FAD/NAD(P)-binding protein n=1 Tax=Streptomyces sp. ISL-66 TaxID=2819186 RepID=UPI0020360786|nr:FAD/NAD(P)-binding protein [Streptomyces sp. ISL-66]